MSSPKDAIQTFGGQVSQEEPVIDTLGKNMMLGMRQNGRGEAR